MGQVLNVKWVYDSNVLNKDHKEFTHSGTPTGCFGDKSLTWG
jgi:hypothetical protein